VMLTFCSDLNSDVVSRYIITVTFSISLITICRLIPSLQEIIHKNSHIHGEIGLEVVNKLMSCTYLSQYDKIACSAVYGYASESEYAKAVSSTGMSSVVSFTSCALLFIFFLVSNGYLRCRCCQFLLSVFWCSNSPRSLSANHCDTCETL
jgi:hypothetical protein